MTTDRRIPLTSAVRGPGIAAGFIAALTLAAMALAPAGSSVVVLAGGGLGGSTYATLTGFASIIRQHTGLDVRVIPSGGLISLIKLGRNEVQGAIGNGPFIEFARRGQPPFGVPYPTVRTVMHGGAGLNLAHFVAARELPISSIAELRDARYPLKVAVDRKGTTDNWIFEHMLGFYGISTADIEAWGGTVREVGYAEQSRLLIDGHIDAVFQNSQVPSSSLIESGYQRHLKFMAFGPQLVDHMIELGWVAQEIARQPYDRIAAEEPVVSVGYAMPLIVNAEVPEDVVYQMVKVLCEHPHEVRAVHRSWRHFDPATAWRDTGAELHPGAARYFREKGYLQE